MKYSDQRWNYFFKAQYRSTEDRGFILLCEIYRTLMALGLLMLTGFLAYFLAVSN